MPRDDLSIDWNRKNMPVIEHQDAAAVLEDFVSRVANLPAEIQFMQEEIAHKDRQMQICLDTIHTRDSSIQKWIRLNTSLVENPKEEQLRRNVLENYDKVQILQEEKCALAQKSQLAMERHIRYLDTNIKALQDRGEFPVDADLPSLLRPQATDSILDSISLNKSAVLSNQSNLSTLGGVNAARLNSLQNSAQRLSQAQVQAAQANVVSTGSGATSPAAATLLLNRQARESSAGAASKRQRLTGGITTVPANSSGLARHSSIGPGTPKAGTPGSAIRAGSVGARGSQKTGISKKVAPHKHGATARKAKPSKSGLSRVKRSGNRNSPSSVNDSEMSDVESGTADEEDEAVTPPPTKGRETEEDLVDVDDDENGDDKKYCICQSVSYGDMVACDNEKCSLEWFHWACVGLKSEPVGTWHCPVCTKNMKKERKEFHAST